MAGKSEMKGKVRIVNGDQESYVLPESVHVWEDLGWKVEEEKKLKKDEPKPTELTTTDGETVTVAPK